MTIIKEEVNRIIGGDNMKLMNDLRWRCPDCGTLVENNLWWDIPTHDCYMKHLHIRTKTKNNRKKKT